MICGIRKFLSMICKIVCVAICSLFVLGFLIWWIFTFSRVEWVYKGEFAGSLHEFQDVDTDSWSFRFDDYGSVDGTYELIMFGTKARILNGAKAMVVKRDSHLRVLHERIFYINREVQGGFLLTIESEFAPKEKGERLNVEITCPQRLGGEKTILLEFKSKLVHHFKSV